MSQSKPSREIVVDDTDPSIEYSDGGWFFDQGTQDVVGTWGPTFNKSSHGIRTNGSLRMGFRGTAVTVVGTGNIISTDNNTVFDPTWGCFVDGNKISNTNMNLTLHLNNVPLCSSSNLQDGDHELRIDVKSNGGLFWLDYVLYVPSPTLPLGPNTTLRIDNLDPDITFAPGWRSFGLGANGTDVSGCQASFKFNGTGITWMGWVMQDEWNGSLEIIEAPSAYTIDGGPLVNFTVPGSEPDKTGMHINRPLFTVQNLEPGPHSLWVVYQGRKGLSELILDHLNIYNVGSVTSAEYPPADPTTLTPPQPSGPIESTLHSPELGVIIGVALGASTLLVILIFFIWLRWRKRNKVAPKRDDYFYPGRGIMEPFLHLPHPETGTRLGQATSPIAFHPSRSKDGRDSLVPLPDSSTRFESPSRGLTAPFTRAQGKGSAHRNYQSDDTTAFSSENPTVLGQVHSNAPRNPLPPILGAPLTISTAMLERSPDDRLHEQDSGFRFPAGIADTEPPAYTAS